MNLPNTQPLVSDDWIVAGLIALCGVVLLMLICRRFHGWVMALRDYNREQHAERARMPDPLSDPRRTGHEEWEVGQRHSRYDEYGRDNS